MHTFETIRAFKRCYTKINRFILCYTVKLKSCLAVWKIKRFFYKRMENVHTEVLCRELKKIKIEYLILQFPLDLHAKEFWSSLVPFYFFKWWRICYTTQLWYDNIFENAVWDNTINFGVQHCFPTMTSMALF